MNEKRIGSVQDDRNIHILSFLTRKENSAVVAGENNPVFFSPGIWRSGIQENIFAYIIIILGIFLKTYIHQFIFTDVTRLSFYSVEK